MSWPAWKSGAGVFLLVLLCGVLAVLQYNWIGEVADAERARLKEEIQTRLSQTRRVFDDRIQTAAAEFSPSDADIERLGRNRAYLDQYHHAMATQSAMIRREALAIPEDGDVKLLMLDPAQDRFDPAEWPPDWAPMHARLRARLQGGPIRSGQSATATLVELPHFGRPGDGPGVREQEWLLLELNTDTLRSTVLPAVLAATLADSSRMDYDVQVTLNGDPSTVIYRSGPSPLVADATVGLLDDINGRGDGRGRARGPGAPPNRDKGDRERGARPGPPPPRGGQGRAGGPGRGGGGGPDDSAWLLSVQHRAGSLEALAATTRRKNLSISAGILLLILTTAVVLLGASREKQRVAELQMNFVAGVSHELRTPLTVIRTAAYNLRKTFAANPEQVERYGELIQKESEKLGTLVEQVLRYGSAKAGSVIQQRQPVEVAALIERSIRASRLPAGNEEMQVEQRIEPGLPPILADEEALKHALQNLLDNAARHGAEGKWIGIFAEAANEGASPQVQIRVADHGPGIPSRELAHIFDPFFRGSRALLDQVHGTGLGLNLVKQIVEAHGGSIRVKSEPMQGTEFIVRIPAGRLASQPLPAGSPS